MSELTVKETFAQMKHSGFDFEQPARVEHFFIGTGDADGREAMEAVAEEAEEQGFTVSDLVLNDPKEDWEDYDPIADKDEKPYYSLLVVSALQKLDEKLVEGECEMMQQLADELGLEYDGWEIDFDESTS